MMSLQDLLRGRQRTCRDELDNMAKSVYARAAWTRLDTIQRLRIEIEAVGDVACANTFVPNIVETLEWWLAEEVDESGAKLFPGLSWEKQVDGQVTTVKVFDEAQEFLVRVDLRPDTRGTEYSKMAKRGEATLESDD